MGKTALITGASAGIGYELSKVFADNGYDLILVARNKQQLEQLADEILAGNDIRVTVIAKDLSHHDAAQWLYDEVVGQALNVDVLVNNAGIATNGYFSDFEPAQHNQVLQLNITTLTLLCRLFGNEMIKQGAGGILNVASTAAFQAGPFMATYYASKAYVLSLSEALNAEMKHKGVKVSVLCPGPTKTDFFQNNNMNSALLPSSPHMMSAASVAMAGFRGLHRGKLIVIPGFINKVLALSVRFLPRSVGMTLTGYLNRCH